MKSIQSVFLFLTIFTAGCTFYQIDSKDSTDQYYPPKTSINEVAYVEKTDKSFTEIGVVTVTTERRQNLEDVLPKLKQEAGMLGADAITDVHSDATDFWKKVTSPKTSQKVLGNAYIRTTYSARAIIWNEK